MNSDSEKTLKDTEFSELKLLAYGEFNEIFTNGRVNRQVNIKILNSDSKDTNILNSELKEGHC